MTTPITATRTTTEADTAMAKVGTATTPCVGNTSLTTGKHCVSSMVLPTIAVYSPGLHVAWASHSSVSVLVDDIAAL